MTVRKSGGIRDEDVLRFMRFNVTESAAATFTEQEYDTQLSIDRGYIWMIHFIEWDINLSQIEDPAQDATETFTGQITRESKSALITQNDSDLIARIRLLKDRSATIGTDAGPVIHAGVSPYKDNYYPAIPYAAQSIYVAIQTSHASVQSLTGRIGYTLARVSEKFFFRVAHALIN